MVKPNDKFWQHKPLDELTHSEWESLCDGCGRCCLLKLEDEDTGEIFFTDVSCKLLDRKTCRCKDYSNRVEKVPDCLVLGMDHPEYFNLLPESCAYRRLHENRPLASWHPLNSGKANTVHTAEISVCGWCTPETKVPTDELEDHIIEFFDEE